MAASFFCAGQLPPSGGPPDTTPPEIVYTYPAPGSLHFRDNRFELAFSKYVDRGSAEGSLFISPSVGELSIDWSGTDVEIHFSDSLRPNTTYILTVGTDVVDTRKNKMAKAFALPFSTGAYLDSAGVSGRVFDPSPAGIMIFAYLLNGRRGDTLNPVRSKPDYETQTGKDGSFNLTNLAIGTYRLMAVRDEYKNILYDVQTDEFGMPNSDVALDSGRMRVSGIQLQMTREDTTRPFLSSARSLDRSHLLLRFSEVMDTTGVRADGVAIFDTVANEKLTVYDFSFVNASSLAAEVVTADQRDSRVYRVMLAGMKDLHGNLLNPAAGSGLFNGSSLIDTSKPVMTPGIQEGETNVQIDDSVDISFSEAIHQPPFEHGFRLSDTSRKPVAGSFKWWNSSRLSFIPSAPLQMSMPYAMTVRLDSLTDFSGNRCGDTVWTRKFRTVDGKSVGNIKGTVEDDSTGATGRIFIIATSVSAREIKPRKQALESPGAFVLDRVVEGRYTMSGFRDADGDGVYTYGMPFPFHPSERFDVFPDTLKVRARWPLEGVVIRFR